MKGIQLGTGHLEVHEFAFQDRQDLSSKNVDLSNPLRVELLVSFNLGKNISGRQARGWIDEDESDRPRRALVSGPPTRLSLVIASNRLLVTATLFPCAKIPRQVGRRTAVGTANHLASDLLRSLGLRWSNNPSVPALSPRLPPTIVDQGAESRESFLPMQSHNAGGSIRSHLPNWAADFRWLLQPPSP